MELVDVSCLCAGGCHIMPWHEFSKDVRLKFVEGKRLFVGN